MADVTSLLNLCTEPLDLSREERAELTVRLFERLRESTSPLERDALRDQIVRLHLPIARSLARRYRGRGEEVADLEQAGYVGLVKAINRFDPELGSFVAFARTTISGEIKRHFRDRAWAIRPTRRVQELEARAVAARALAEQTNGRAATVADVADAMGEDRGAVSEALGASVYFNLRSLDARRSGAVEGSTWADHVGADDAGYDAAEARAELARALATLDDVDREIVGMRFFGQLTQSEIADQIGTSQMQVSRALTRIFARLRDQIGPVWSQAPLAAER